MVCFLSAFMNTERASEAFHFLPVWMVGENVIMLVWTVSSLSTRESGEMFRVLLAILISFSLYCQSYSLLMFLLGWRFLKNSIAGAPCINILGTFTYEWRKLQILSPIGFCLLTFCTQTHESFFSLMYSRLPVCLSTSPFPNFEATQVSS